MVKGSSKPSGKVTSTKSGKENNSGMKINQSTRPSCNDVIPSIPVTPQQPSPSVEASSIASCSNTSAPTADVVLSNGHAVNSNVQQSDVSDQSVHMLADRESSVTLTTGQQKRTSEKEIAVLSESQSNAAGLKSRDLALSGSQPGDKRHKTKDARSNEILALGESEPASAAVSVSKPSFGEPKPRTQMTKAERREIQEAQREAKAKGKPHQQLKSSGDGFAKPQPPKQNSVALSAAIPDATKQQQQQSAGQKSTQKAVVATKVLVPSIRQGLAEGSTGTFEVFSHLQKYQGTLPYDERFVRPTKYPIHPAFIRLGALNARRVVEGSNARCVGLIYALKQVIRDYVTPPDKDLSRDLEAKIKPYINFLTQCRPMSVSMGNAVRHTKHLITNSPGSLSEQAAKERLIDELDFFINEKILLAGEAISKTYACEKVNNGDNILTYAWSDLVTKVLCDAHRMGRKFRVTVVDSRPRMEGRETLRRLVEAGVPCSYVSVTAVSYVMPEVSKVLLGAESLLANGYVMSHVGTSQLCLVAKAFNKPVLVCCETYKFCERVQTDSIVNNELGNPYDVDVPASAAHMLLSTAGSSAGVAEGLGAVHATNVAGKSGKFFSSGQEAAAQQATPYLSRLNLLFDVTPPDLITVVITEVGMVPCTSVPVVLRVKHVL